MITISTESLERSIAQGLDFLAQQQKPEGDFCCIIAENAAFTQNAREDPSPFFTQHILASLMEVAGPARILISTKIRKFLLRDVCPGCIWKFWNKEHPGSILIPPDVDDTSCIAYLIEPSALPSHQTRSVLLGNRNSVGLFYTWILPRLGHLYRPQTWIPLYHNFKNPKNTITFFRLGNNKPDPFSIDTVVNANAILYLGESSATKPAINWICRVVATATEASADRWYQSKYSLYYAIARCKQSGVHGFDKIIPILTERLKDEIDASGSCYNVVLDTALAANVLACCQPTCRQLDQAVEFLLSTQQPNGGWPISVFFHDGFNAPGLYWGSAEMVTAMCLEALSKFMKIRFSDLER
jgi:hypothetical protein